MSERVRVLVTLTIPKFVSSYILRKEVFVYFSSVIICILLGPKIFVYKLSLVNKAYCRRAASGTDWCRGGAGSSPRSHGRCVVPLIVRLYILLVTERWRFARPGRLRVS